MCEIRASDSIPFEEALERSVILPVSSRLGARLSALVLGQARLIYATTPFHPANQAGGRVVLILEEPFCKLVCLENFGPKKKRDRQRDWTE